MENIITGLSIALVIALFYCIFCKLEISRLSLKLHNTSEENQRLTMQLAHNDQLLNSMRDEKIKLVSQLSQVSTQYESLKERFDESLNNKEMELARFEQIATRVMEEKTNKFDQQHKAGIKEILAPLNDKIKSFEARIEKTHLESAERHGALRNQIKMLTELNEKITQEANNLTNALKSDTKRQGNWGELILESILEKSGLEKGREYHVQKSLVSPAGKRLQPDVIIDLPDKKRIIIDSKVSLVAYERFVNAESTEESEQALKAHLHSIRKHINELSDKCYHNLYQMESPDFVLMFVPIETAFSAVLKYDDRMYNYAFDKNIVIVTPSTLLATLKTVDTIWKNEKHNKNALEIAIEAGKMYDKFVSFSEDMSKLGRQLDTVRQTYGDSMNKLTSGTGNLVRRAEKLKKLGAKTSKLFADRLIEMTG